MKLRDHQGVAFGNRIDVHESQDVIVFEDLETGDLAQKDLAEDAVFVPVGVHVCLVGHDRRLLCPSIDPWRKPRQAGPWTPNLSRACLTANRVSMHKGAFND